MKRIYVFYVLMVLIKSVSCQYVPTLQDNNIWYEYYYFESSENKKFIVTGDSVIEDIQYKVITEYYQDTIPVEYWVFREDVSEQKVYMKRNNDSELLMYDYSLQVKDTFWFPENMWQNDNYTILDSITNNLSAFISTIGHNVNIDIEDRRVFYFSNPNAQTREFIWIEGIGSIHGICNDYEYQDHNLLCFYNSEGEMDLHLNVNETCSGGLVGIDKHFTKTNLIVYPNPTEAFFIVENDSFEKIEVLSLQGKEILSSTEKRIDVRHLPSGIYIIKASIGNNKLVQKLIKK